MFKFKKRKKSIAYKIWLKMVQFTSVLLIIFLIGIIFIYRDTEAEYSYMELESYANSPNIREFVLGEELLYKSKDLNDIDEELFEKIEKINELQERHYKIYTFTAENKSGIYKINIDNSQFRDDDFDIRYQIILDEIENKMNEGVSKVDKGYKSYGLEMFYYYVDWNDDYSHANIYINYSLRSLKIIMNVLVTFFLLIILTFITSKLIANQISKPIKEIEEFTDEISHKNWDVIVPTYVDDEIGQVMKALENMKNSLIESEIKEREFLHARSHDLKTPVMLIKGYAQSIIDGVDIKSGRSAPEIIVEESERLEHKIQQLLRLNSFNISSVDESSFEVIRIDRLLKSLTNKFKTLKSNLIWETNFIESEINANSEMLLIAFENIIENQIRYANTLIKIDMIWDKHLKIIISNDGEHFEVEEPNTLFETYKKGNSGNYGLGLAITKQIIEAHGGQVNARNNDIGISIELDFYEVLDTEV